LLAEEEGLKKSLKVLILLLFLESKICDIFLLTLLNWYLTIQGCPRKLYYGTLGDKLRYLE